MEMTYMVEYSINSQDLRRGEGRYLPVGVWVQAPGKAPVSRFANPDAEETAKDRIKSVSKEELKRDDFLFTYRDRIGSYSGMCNEPVKTDEFKTVEECLDKTMAKIVQALAQEQQ